MDAPAIQRSGTIAEYHVPTSKSLESQQTQSQHRSIDSFLEDAYHSQARSTTTPIYPRCQATKYWCIMLSLGVANSCDASEILCLSYILSDDDFQNYMLHHTKWRAGLLAGSVFFGMLLGGLLVGSLGDSLGRRPMLLVGLICNALAGTLSALCMDAWQLSLIRGIAGIGIGATVPPLFTLVTELAPPSRRGFFVTVAASFWMVGSIYVALVALLTYEYFQQSWRVFALACALPSALGVVLVSTLVPESPRFLALQGRLHEACAVTNRLAQSMDFRGPPLSLSELFEQYPLRSHHAAQLAGQHRHGGLSPPLSWIRQLLNPIQEKSSDFVAATSTLYTPSLRSTTWPLQLVWFSLSFGSYGIVTWVNSIFVAVHLENVYWNALLFALSNLPGNVMSAYLMDRSGRAGLLVSSCLLAALSLMSFAGFAWGTKSFGIVASACAFQAFSISAWNTIDCMTSELFPTTVRSTGMGVCAASGRIGAMVAQFVNGMLMESPVSLLAVASLSLVVAGMIPSLLPRGTEMAQRPLRDVVSDGDASSAMETLVPNRDDLFSVAGTNELGKNGDAEVSYRSLDQEGDE